MKHLDLISRDPVIAELLVGEERRQRDGLELIPSENYVSLAVMEAMGTVLNNKYSEGYPGRRYYGGQDFTDQIEELAIARAKELFRAGHANVQPHAGAPANIAVYFALMQPGDTILGMDLTHGGHLTHGHPVTYISKIFNFIRYKMCPNGDLDYEEIGRLALAHKPKIILVGFSSYPRSGTIDYKRIKVIAEQVGAYTMADVAHIAGLIAGGVAQNPLDDGFDVLTTTTHKTLRGPRGGLILTRAEKTSDIAKRIDQSVFPGFQGGPIMQMIAAKAVAFHEALQSEFRVYAQQVLFNAQCMAKLFMQHGVQLITNGTDNHLLVLNVINSWGLSGKTAQTLFDRINITTNMNVIPDDPRKPMDPSGLRLGTPAVTTRGMKEPEMEIIVDCMLRAVVNRDHPIELDKIKAEITTLARKFPVPGVDAEV